CRSRLRQLGDVPEALPFGAALVLAAPLATLGVGGAEPKIVETRLERGRVAGQLVVRAARGLELAPRARSVPGVEAGVGVEHTALVARARQPPLLELTAHG